MAQFESLTRDVRSFHLDTLEYCTNKINNFTILVYIIPHSVRPNIKLIIILCFNV